MAWVVLFTVAAGGGGGGGRALGAAGTSGLGLSFASGGTYPAYGPYEDGQPGTLFAPGAGSTSSDLEPGGPNYNIGGPDGGPGGIGGNFGAAGAPGNFTGPNFTARSNPAAGGAPGPAIVGGANITWFAHNIRLGTFDSLGTNTVPAQGTAGQIPAPDPGDDGGGSGSVSVTAFMPFMSKLAGQFEPGDSLMLLDEGGESYMSGTVVSNRVSLQKRVRLISSSGISLTCSDNTPLTLRDGTCINSTEALGVELPVYDKDGFRWEEIVSLEHLENPGYVATIYCENQCYAAGDEPDRFIFTHNMAGNNSKN